MSIVITEEQMPIARLIALRTGVKLEGKAKGMKMTRGRSCMARVKSEFGWSGNRETIIQKLRKCMKDCSIQSLQTLLRN